MLKRILVSIVMLSCIVVLLPTIAFASDSRNNIFIDNQKVALTSSTGTPIMVKGRVYVPMRVVSENLGYKVEWLPKIQTVVVTNKDTEIALVINNTVATINGKDVKIDDQNSKPFIEKGRTYVPIRFISEGFGLKVDWIKPNVYITKKGSTLPVGFVPADQVLKNFTGDNLNYVNLGLEHYPFPTANTGVIGKPSVIVHPDFFGKYDVEVYDVAYLSDAKNFLQVATNFSGQYALYIIKDEKIVHAQLGITDVDGKNAQGQYVTEFRLLGSVPQLLQDADQIGIAVGGGGNVTLFDVSGDIKVKNLIPLKK